MSLVLSVHGLSLLPHVKSRRMGTNPESSCWSEPLQCDAAHQTAEHGLVPSASSTDQQVLPQHLC